MTRLDFIRCWIRNIFNIGRPKFSHLAFADYIVEDKSYFVFSWRMEKAHLLKIKSAKYKSYLKSGSAYLPIDSGIEQLEIIISNSWSSRKYLLKLHQISLNEAIDFPATLRNCFDVKFLMPNMHQKFIKLKVNPFKVSAAEQTQLKRIINISYPN